MQVVSALLCTHFVAPEWPVNSDFPSLAHDCTCEGSLQEWVMNVRRHLLRFIRRRREK